MAPKSDLILKIVTIDAYPETARVEAPKNEEAVPVKAGETDEASSRFSVGDGLPERGERVDPPAVPTAFRSGLIPFGDGETHLDAPLSVAPLVELAALRFLRAPQTVENAVASLKAFLEPKTETDPREVTSIQEQVRDEILSQLQSSSPRIADRVYMDQRATALLHFDATTGALIPGARMPQGADVFSIQVRMDGNTNRIQLQPGTAENLNAFVDDGMSRSLRNVVEAITSLDGQPIFGAAPETMRAQLTAGTTDPEIVTTASREQVDAAFASIFGLIPSAMTFLVGGHFRTHVLSVNLKQGTIYLGPKGEILGGSIAMPGYANPRGRSRDMGLLAGTPVDIVLGPSLSSGGREMTILFLGPQRPLNAAQTALLQGVTDRAAADQALSVAENPYLIDASLADLGHRPHYLTDFPRSFALTLDEVTHYGDRDFNGTLHVGWNPQTGSYVADVEGGEKPLGTVRVVYSAESKRVSMMLRDVSGLDAGAAQGIHRFLEWFSKRAESEPNRFY